MFNTTNASFGSVPNGAQVGTPTGASSWSVTDGRPHLISSGPAMTVLQHGNSLTMTAPPSGGLPFFFPFSQQEVLADALNHLTWCQAPRIADLDKDLKLNPHPFGPLWKKTLCNMSTCHSAFLCFDHHPNEEVVVGNTEDKKGQVRMLNLMCASADTFVPVLVNATPAVTHEDPTMTAEWSQWWWRLRHRFITIALVDRQMPSSPIWHHDRSLVTHLLPEIRLKCKEVLVHAELTQTELDQMIWIIPKLLLMATSDCSTWLQLRVDCLDAVKTNQKPARNPWIEEFGVFDNDTVQSRPHRRLILIQAWTFPYFHNSVMMMQRAEEEFIWCAWNQEYRLCWTLASAPIMLDNPERFWSKYFQFETLYGTTKRRGDVMTRLSNELATLSKDSDKTTVDFALRLITFSTNVGNLAQPMTAKSETPGARS